jgi:predicted Zn-dependent protease
MTGNSDDFLDQIMNQGPSPDTLFLVLERIKAAGRPKEVIQKCVDALSVYPNAIPLRRLLAEAYMEVGSIGQAEAELKRATSQVEQLIPIFKTLAQTYVQQKRTEEAIVPLTRYLAHYPQDKDAIDLLNRIQVPAEQEVEKGKPADPVLATPELAEIYFNQGQIHEAIKAYEDILSRNPEDRGSAQRLKELNAFLKDQSGDLPAEAVSDRAKKEKMVKILEKWLPRIRELKSDG